MHKTLTAMASAVVALVVTMGPAPAKAQPYGGCVEAWQAPHSQGARDCRRDGWIIRPRIIVGPYGYVRYNKMPLCRNEDGSYRRRNGTVGLQRHCFWNAHAVGNGRGETFFIDHLHGRTNIVYVIG
jgi:hypothetical protein